MALLPERKITARGYRDGDNKERKGQAHDWSSHRTIS